MNKACIFFKGSDIVMHFPRNYKRYPEISRVKGYTYREGFGSYTQADFYYMEGIERYPVLVNVHGGGFVKGGKQYRKSISCEFAKEGFFVYNINYRLAPPYAFPAGCEDVVCALNRLPELAKTYPLDLNNVTLTGDSAGGFYALSAIVSAINDSYRTELGLPEVKVTPTAFMGFCGAYRLGDLLLKKTPFDLSLDIASALFGKKIKSTEDVVGDPMMKYVDLIAFVNEKMPKSFLLYSTHDDFCGGQGEALRDKLLSLNVPVTSCECAGENDFHCFHLLPRHKTTPWAMENARNFLREIK